MSDKNQQKILLAGGGTAGHVEPALATANWLKENSPDLICEFVGTLSGLETSLVPLSGFTLHTIKKAALPRKFSLQSIAWPFRFLQSLSGARKALAGVELVIGFGGYVCAPIYVMARMRKIPILIHEANAHPGWANHLGVRLGGEPLISFEKSREFGAAWKTAKNVGIPLRKEICTVAQFESRDRLAIRIRKAAEWGFNPEKPIVLVFGGSLGSQHINKVLSEALPLISKSGIQVVHGVGKNNPLPASFLNYKPVSYFSDMHEAYAAADLVISRSGAVTCHELGVIGTYALLIPLSVGNGEQRFNGEALVAEGAATMISSEEFTSRWLTDHLLGLLATAKERTSGDGKILFPLDAAEKIGKRIVEKVGVGK